MKIVVDISVKFRVWNVTLGTVTRHYEQAINLPVGIPAAPLFMVNDRGVLLTIRLA